MKKFFHVALIAIFLFGGYMFIRDPTYMSKVIINKPYETVWVQFSDPENYAQLYPNWIKKIKKTAENRWSVDDQFGNSYEIEAKLNKEFGVVDLQIGVETSRLRLIPLNAQSTAVIHLAKKWNRISSLGWFFHKRTTNKDLRNAKKVIEAQ